LAGASLKKLNRFGHVFPKCVFPAPLTIVEDPARPLVAGLWRLSEFGEQREHSVMIRIDPLSPGFDEATAFERDGVKPTAHAISGLKEMQVDASLAKEHCRPQAGGAKTHHSNFQDPISFPWFRSRTAASPTKRANRLTPSPISRLRGASFFIAKSKNPKTAKADAMSQAPRPLERTRSNHTTIMSAQINMPTL